MTYQSYNHFSIWDYSPSLSQLLIRNSALDNSLYCNEDIVFIGVFYMQLGIDFNGICINEIPKSDIESYGLKTPKHPQEKYFSITCNGKQYVIGAIAFSVIMNDLAYNESLLTNQPVKQHQIVTS
ncbi:hypothetical protein SAMN05444266_10892 [Chitinophaga jiangningensis]|uniref:Uncharacterized protein n=1 Tax=Chitinophaga jiangningensis TaxID=1419482 RepID=A0A1M7IU22_9BACT|nr:hypothetical protein SAMN05444266_10892 [Chitinophaga jiangningensis]